MSINMRCPKCGSYKVQLSDERSKHGCFWFLVFGILYLIWIPIKWCIGVMILLLFDWWMALIKALCHKGYVWKYTNNIEKQIPKKPVDNPENGWFECPNCGLIVWVYYGTGETHHCDCGQRLDWEGIE